MVNRLRNASNTHEPLSGHRYIQSLEKALRDSDKKKTPRFPNIGKLSDHERLVALRSLENLGDSIHDLPSVVVDELVNASVTLIEKNEKQEIEPFGFDDVINSFVPSDHHENDKEESVTTKAFRAWRKLCDQQESNSHRIEALGRWFDLAGQDAQLCDPAYFLELQVSLYHNPRVDDHIRARALGVLASRFAVGGGAFFDALDTQIAQAASTRAKAVYLDLAREMYHRAADGAYNHDSVNHLREVIQKHAALPSDNALMHIRTEQVARELSSTSLHFAQEDRDPVPFLFDGKRFAFHREGVLYLTDPADYENIKEAVSVFMKADTASMKGVDELMRRMNSALKKGQSGYVFSDRDTKLLERIKQKDAHSYVSKVLRELRGTPFSERDIMPFRGALALPISPDDLADFEYLMRPSTRLIVRDALGVDVERLSAREKYYFLSFLKRQGSLDMQKVRQFVNDYDMDGVRTFLAASVDPKVGDEILALGDVSDPERVQTVFGKFAEFADRIESLEEYLDEKFGHADESMAHEAAGRLLARGRNLLGKAHAHKDNPEELEKLIASLDTETRVFGDLARLYIDRGYKLTDIVGVDVRSIPGGALKGDLRRELTKMHREGYERSGEYSPQQIENLERSLEAKFDDASSEFKVVIESAHDKPLAALRFDLEKDEKGDVSSVYLASVMSDGNLEGSRIGLLNVETQIKAQLEAHDLPITAVANPRAPITSNYLEMGFIVVGVTESSDGKPFFKLEMRKDLLSSLTTIGGRASESAIASAAKSGAVSPDGSVIRIPASTLEEVLAKLSELKKEDPAWCMTRYVRDKSSKESPRYYAVFERPTSTS